MRHRWGCSGARGTFAFRRACYADRPLPTMFRYPRTRHLAGSFLPPGDDEGDMLPFGTFANKRVVVSEKVDGANAAISFTDEGRMLLQSRSRILDPEHIELGPYAGLHAWSQRVEDELFRVLGTRYVMYGEWVKKKQSVFYDALPQDFLEMDVLDKTSEQFLSTPLRRSLLRPLPLASVPVLAEGTFSSMDELVVFLGPSRFKTPRWRDELLQAIWEAEVSDADRFLRETDPSDDMEGLVIKLESAGAVLERAKFVRFGARQDFMNASVNILRTRRVENRVTGRQ